MSATTAFPTPAGAHLPGFAVVAVSFFAAVAAAFSFAAVAAAAATGVRS
jgi:hypothetical protein